MHVVTEQQVDFIMTDLKRKGLDTDDLVNNILDHVCCIIEQEMPAGEDFESYYSRTVSRFYKVELSEIQKETELLLTFKNYYSMKKTLIFSGFTTIFFFVSAVIFNFFSLTGTTLLFMAGITVFCFVFLPLLFVVKNKEVKTGLDRFILLLGIILAALFFITLLFSQLSWGWTSYGWIVLLFFSFFIFIPLYFIVGYRRPETRTNTIVTTIIIVSFTSMIALFASRLPGKRNKETALQQASYNFLNTEKLIHHLESSTDTLQSFFAGDSLKKQLWNDISVIKLKLMKDCNISVNANPAEILKENHCKNNFSEKYDAYVNNLRMNIGVFNVGHKNKPTALSVQPIILQAPLPELYSYSNIQVLSSLNEVAIDLLNN